MAYKNLLQNFSRKALSAILSSAVFGSSVASAQAGDGHGRYFPPEVVPPISSAEYFPPSAEKQMLIQVNVWGEVARPGVYYVPEKSTTRYTLSLAGGPSGLASMPNIHKISSNGNSQYLDLLKDGQTATVEPMDTIIVERSWFKADLPPTLGILSTLLGIITVSLAMQSKN